MFRLICIVIGYFIGCIQSAYFVGKLMGNIDIRQYGSGNAGTTNMARVLGFKAGLTVFICDVLKGIIAFIICALLFKGGSTFFDGQSLVPGIYGGIGAILGHNYPFYLNFKGGKGIATTAGIILCLNWKIAVVTYIVAAVIMLGTKLISLGSLISVLIPVIMLIIFKANFEEIILVLLIACMAYYQHIPNIKRLLKGEEKKFKIKK